MLSGSIPPSARKALHFLFKTRVTRSMYRQTTICIEILFGMRLCRWKCENKCVKNIDYLMHVYVAM